MKPVVREIIEAILLALLLYLVIQIVVQTFEVIGSSMEPGLHNGQRLLAGKAAYWFRPPQRGDVIVFFYPQADSDRDIVKRVIALPGETIEIKNGYTYIDGIPIEEPYIKEQSDRSLPPQKVPPDHYFVLGDNRNQSRDSRSWGPLPSKAIIGKVWFSLWPWGRAPNYSLQVSEGG